MPKTKPNLCAGGIYFLFGLVGFILISDPPVNYVPGGKANSSQLEMKPSGTYIWRPLLLHKFVKKIKFKGRNLD
jgi:hypothetical protein